MNIFLETHNKYIFPEKVFGEEAKFKSINKTKQKKSISSTYPVDTVLCIAKICFPIY